MKTHITTDSDKYSQGLSYAVNSDKKAVRGDGWIE